MPSQEELLASLGPILKGIETRLDLIQGDQRALRTRVDEGIGGVHSRLDRLGRRVSNLDGAIASHLLERAVVQNDTLASKHVVIAEDTDLVLDMFVRIVELRQGNVIADDNGAGIRRLLERRKWCRPCAAIVDFHLACTMTGLGLARWLREQYGDSIKILLTTGDGPLLDEHAEEIAELGVLVCEKSTVEIVQRITEVLS